jgi:hypothetical protein
VTEIKTVHTVDTEKLFEMSQYFGKLHLLRFFKYILSVQVRRLDYSSAMYCNQLASKTIIHFFLLFSVGIFPFLITLSIFFQNFA